MKNILMILYYYPPKGGIGVQRNVKFAKYLCKFGYNVHVLTVDEEFCGSLVDHSLENDVLNDIAVHRTFIKEGHIVDRLLSIAKRNSRTSEGSYANVQPNNLWGAIKQIIIKAARKIILDINSLIYIPDAQIGWVKYAVEAGEQIIEENKIDVIYTTSSPYSSHIIGYKLAMKYGIKWIADFRDPWVQNSFADYNFIVKYINALQEKKVVKKADIVMSVSQPIIDDFKRAYKSEREDKFRLLTNGYDEEDFRDLKLDLSDQNEKFTILYNGSLYGKESPEPVFIAVKNLIEQGKIDKDRVRLRFIGDMGSSQRAVFEYYREIYPDIYEHCDFVPHKESLEELCRANALLLILDDIPGSDRIYTGKIFEYIRSGKPILAIVPNGVARDLIEYTNTGYTAYPMDQNQIDDIFYRAYRAYFDRTSEIKPVHDRINQYSREVIAKELSNIIENI